MSDLLASVRRSDAETARATVPKVPRLAPTPTPTPSL